MASIYRRRPSIAASVRSDFRDDGSNATGTSYILTNDRNEYSDDHIKILYEIVVRAEELLPTLPESYRRPIPALLKAYNEVLPEYGIHPEDDHQITKLVFKVGGVFGRGSLMDKFRAALSRMNITLELDVPQSHPVGTGDEYPESISMSDSLSNGVPNHPASGEEGDDEYPGTDNGRDYYSNGGETSDDYTIPKDDLGTQLDENDSYTIPRSEHDVQFDHPAHKVLDAARDADAIQSRIEQNLENSAIAFHERYHGKFSVLAALRQWQGYSESMTFRWNQYREALESDMVGVVEDTFRAWRMLSAEAEEVPPPYLPSNIYSKRTEQIAARTYQIFAIKNAFTRWRRYTKEQCRKREQKVEKEPLDPLERVALKAHETLMLSRAFVRWSNRSNQEVRKSRMAAKIYEMGLKSKALGSRHRPEDTVLDYTPSNEDLGPVMPSAEAPAFTEEDELFHGDSRSAEMQQKAEMARKLFLMRSLANRRSATEKSDKRDLAVANEETASDDEDHDRLQETQHSVQLTQQLSSIKALAARRKQSTHERNASKPANKMVAATALGAEKSVHENLAEKPDERIQDQLDERTLLARRHILRMRFFSAWENYTSSHVTKVKRFAVQKTIEPWRQRVTESNDTERNYTRNRQNRVSQRTVSAWIQVSKQSGDIEDKTMRARQRLCIEHALKPWMAASHERQKLSDKKSWAFNNWFDHEDDEAVLMVMANQHYFSQRTEAALRHWKAAREAKSARRTVFKTYGDRAVYYYNVTGALRAWKAAAREASIRKYMKSDALEMWRKTWHDGLPHQEEMRCWAEEINFSNSAAKALPIWRSGAQRAAEIRQRRQTYAEKADYYYKTKGTLSAWRASAQARHKANIKKAHSEARRMIKKGMGARCLAAWRARLLPSFDRFEAMNAHLDEALAHRAWQQAQQTFDIWRDRALAQADAQADADARTQQRALDRWRGAAADSHQRRTNAAAQHRRDKAAARALRGWNLASLQRMGRAHTVANVREKRDRRLLRIGFEAWYDRRATTAAAAVDAGGGDDFDFDDLYFGAGGLEDQEAPAYSSPLKGKMNAAAPPPAPAPVSAPAPEDDIYIPTPGRPRLPPLFGSLGSHLPLQNAATSVGSTTPLAPVPSRGGSSWNPSATVSGRDSVLKRSLPPPAGSAASARASRSRRNLRVSWAD
ncbi:hypothetical protein SLS62_005708 [Diatrype stigma]|uniref:Sfi1 spindle body domain-containing protein n=1 Tax=Diatrype stigma TaxID=117547 RepID=A0AAN9USB7_9PEZI